MNDAIAEAIKTGVGLCVVTAVMFGISVIFSSSLQMNSELSMQKSNNIAMKEYAEFNQYDFTHVYSQDVITAVFQYRGFPAVKVVDADGDIKIWSQGSSATVYTATEISDAINKDVVYDADIERNGNGQIVTIIFRACDNGTYCGGR